jgi:hypothetical protein
LTRFPPCLRGNIIPIPASDFEFRISDLSLKFSSHVVSPGDEGEIERGEQAELADEAGSPLDDAVFHLSSFGNFSKSTSQS